VNRQDVSKRISFSLRFVARGTEREQPRSPTLPWGSCPACLPGHSLQPQDKVVTKPKGETEIKDFKQPAILVLQNGPEPQAVLHPSPQVFQPSPSQPLPLAPHLSASRDLSFFLLFLSAHQFETVLNILAANHMFFMSNLLVIFLPVASFLWTLRTTTHFRCPFPSQTRARQRLFSLVGSCSCKSNSYFGILNILNHKSPFPRVFSAFFFPCVRI